jgi:hypothetical protein
MKFKELELSNTEKLQVFCNFIVSNTIGSTTPKCALWSAFGIKPQICGYFNNDFCGYFNNDLLASGKVTRVTEYSTHKCIELLIPVDEEFYERFINEEN